jgi:hypothetical protein
MLLTYNADDFLDLHHQQRGHAGILIVYRDANLAKNLSYTDIVQAIQNPVASGVPVEGEIYVLNYWQW